MYIHALQYERVLSVGGNAAGPSTSTAQPPVSTPAQNRAAAVNNEDFIELPDTNTPKGRYFTNPKL